jgi:hypothetical protein
VRMVRDPVINTVERQGTVNINGWPVVISRQRRRFRLFFAFTVLRMIMKCARQTILTEGMSERKRKQIVHEGRTKRERTTWTTGWSESSLAPTTGLYFVFDEKKPIRMFMI